MSFTINNNTSISNVPDIKYPAIINTPSVMAKISIAYSNSTIQFGNLTLTGNTLTLITG